MAVDHKEQYGIVVRQVRHGEGTRARVTHLEVNLVACLERRWEVPAGFVRHRPVRGQFRVPADEYVESCRVRVGVADAELVLELERTHEARPLVAKHGGVGGDSRESEE